LGRDPDEGGLEYYMKLAKDKKWSPYRIATAHLGSDEYKGVLGKDSGKGRGALPTDHSYGRPYDLMDELAHAQSAGNTSFDDIQNAAGLESILQQYRDMGGFGGSARAPGTIGYGPGGIGNVLSNIGSAARGMVSGAGNIARQGIDALQGDEDSDQDGGFWGGIGKLLSNLPGYNVPRAIANIGEEYFNMAGGGYLGQDNFNRVNGQISGRGTETSDNIPAMLSDGEFVFNAKALRGIGSLNGAKNNPEEQRRQGARAMYAFQRAGENALKGGV
jgi:hypothetical protein